LWLIIAKENRGKNILRMNIEMWKHKNTFAIGGLENVGFANGSDHLIVLSAQGKGIFNCFTGEKMFRSEEEWWKDFDEKESTVKGFDFLENATIKICGLHGEDKLSKKTSDGWTITASEKTPDDHPFEKYLVTKIFLNNPDHSQSIFITKDGPCELRVFGFSETGKSLIVGTSCDLVIWSRE
jgi:hypothetical protein